MGLISKIPFTSVKEWKFENYNTTMMLSKTSFIAIQNTEGLASEPVN